MVINIIPTIVEHINDIIIVENLSFKIPWSKEAFIQEVTKNTFARYISAGVEDRIIGYAGLWKVCDEGHITNIAVHPDFRGMGVGNELMKHIIEIAKNEGVTRMTLEVRKSNLVAFGLYCKYGFDSCGIRKAYYADNHEDAVIMWKENI